MITTSIIRFSSVEVCLVACLKLVSFSSVFAVPVSSLGTVHLHTQTHPHHIIHDIHMIKNYILYHTIVFGHFVRGFVSIRDGT